MSSTIRNISEDEAANMESLRKLSGFGQKVIIDIKINNPRPTYTTLDRIEGIVSILAPMDTNFDEIDIEFVGTSRTYVERLTAAAAVSGRSEAFHQFLKLQDKSVQDLYPEDRILRAGKPYSFPFVFVVPQHLLPKICGHTCKAAGVREAHLQLPPTFGDHDREDPTDGKVLDDLVPEMASTRYGVHVRVCKAKLVDEEITRRNIANKARRVRVIPATEEQPPLDIDSDDKEYSIRREKVVRKGVLHAKAGTMVMEAIQPPAIRMRSRGDPEKPAMSNAKIMLRYDPADKHSLPPFLTDLSTKLKVCTFFASTARSTFPDKKKALQDPSQGVHSDQLNLSTRKMGNVASKWTTYESEADAVRGSASSTSCIPAASKDYKGGKFFAAQIEAPISLPTNKAFVPSFHSCLISRMYQVKFELGIQNKGFGTMDLKLPIQISCAEDGDWSPRRGSMVDDIEAEVDGFFDPRTMHIPDEAFIGHSDIRRPSPPVTPRDELPPSYSFFPVASGQTVPAY
ncbi:putative arrestin-like protein [Septoria linicola]|nr:putative arrestin-like protein [Septoria linicola]